MDRGIKGLLGPNVRNIYSNLKINENHILEVRMRINGPLIIVTRDCEILDTYIICSEDIKSTIDLVSNYSLYAYEDEVRQGFITVKGGHRVGITGQVVMENGRVKSVKHISFVNIRVAHEIKGCGDFVIPYLFSKGRVMNTLIVSPPGCGKTTILRDLIRIISDGSKFSKGMNVGVVDERSEICACYMGVPQNDVGVRTDVLDACPKADGMIMLLRSMNPKVIAVDEIGSREDVEAISYVINSGCGVIATIHGNAIDDIRTRPVLRRLVDQRYFERYVVLSNSAGVGTCESIFDERGNELYIPLLSMAN